MKKLKAAVIAELSLIFFLWLISVWVSRPYFNRPLGEHHEWETAHILVSMRAFEEWGFWNLMGVSVFVPHSQEWLGVNLPEKAMVISQYYSNAYLSSPDGYIIFPYLIRKLLNFIPLISIPLSPLFLESFNLLLGRLFTGTIIYYLFLEIIKIFMPDSRKIYQQRLLAFLGLIAWLFNPPVLYFTQNTFFGEKTYLGFVYVIFLLAVRCQFRFSTLSKAEKALLFFVSFIACGTSYYGWLSVAIISLAVFFDQLFFFPSVKFRLVFRKYLKSIIFMVWGALIAGILFLVQLLYYKDGLIFLFDRFWHRTGLLKLFNDNGGQENIIHVLAGLVFFWDNYFPLGGLYWPELRLGFVLLALVIVLALPFLLLKSQDKKLVIYVYSVVFFVPLSYIILLKQWSFTHDFSAFLMGLPIVFSSIILPVLLVEKASPGWRPGLFKKYGTRLAFIIVTIVVLAVTLESKKMSIQFASPANLINQDFGKIIDKYFRPGDLIITFPRTQEKLPFLSQSLVVQPDPPEALWYAKRYIYDLSQLQNLISTGKLDFERINKMTPVYIAYKEEANLHAQVASICRGKWVEIKEKLGTRTLVMCRTPELRRLLPSVLPR